MEILLPESMIGFVQHQIHAHGYHDASEYVCELIQAEELEQQLLKGLASGLATPMTQQDWMQMRQALVAKFSDNHA